MADLKAERAVAAFDSATAMVRAVGRSLRGDAFPRLGRGPAAAVPVRLSALLPSGPRRSAYALLGGTEGVPPDRLGDVEMDGVAEWVTRHYGAGPFPGVVVGSSNGAAVHLCAATGMPFLPQTLLVPVHRPDGDPDRPDTALTFGRDVAGPLLRRNPGVVLHHMHDGVQDRLMVDRMAYFRLKWRTLPPAYERFLRERLAPGAPVLLLADRSSWPVTTVAERHVFQTGARGGVLAEEYLHGSPRLTRFLHESGSPVDRFPAPEPDTSAPEAEWGFEPGLETAIRDVVGDRVRTIAYPHPQTLSGPVADLLRARIRAAGGDGSGLLVESFVMLDPVEAFRTGQTPFWTFFGVDAARSAVVEHLTRAEQRGDPYHDAHVLSFPNGVAGPGAVAPKDWLRSLQPHLAGRIGLVPGSHRWPAHFDTLVRYSPALRALPTATAPTRAMPVADVVAALAVAADGRRESLHRDGTA